VFSFLFDRGFNVRRASGWHTGSAAFYKTTHVSIRFVCVCFSPRADALMMKPHHPCIMISPIERRALSLRLNQQYPQPLFMHLQLPCACTLSIHVLEDVFSVWVKDFGNQSVFLNFKPSVSNQLECEIYSLSLSPGTSREKKVWCHSGYNRGKSLPLVIVIGLQALQSKQSQLKVLMSNHCCQNRGPPFSFLSVFCSLVCSFVLSSNHPKLKFKKIYIYKFYFLKHLYSCINI